MKSYEEMAHSVLARAMAQKREHKRRQGIIAVTATVCCICLALVGAFAVRKEQNTAHMETEPRVKLMMLSDGETAQAKELIRDVVEPYQYVVHVMSLEGLTDIQVAELIQQEKEYAQSLWSPGAANKSYTHYQNKDLLITVMSAGLLMLYVEDYDSIADYSVTTTQTGYIDTEAHMYKQETQGIGFGWNLSNETIDKIRNDPDLKLSSLSDTITVCVEFKDGTTETVTADVSFEDNGQVLITQRGTLTDA